MDRQDSSLRIQITPFQRYEFPLPQAMLQGQKEDGQVSQFSSRIQIFLYFCFGQCLCLHLLACVVAKILRRVLIDVTITDRLIQNSRKKHTDVPHSFRGQRLISTQVSMVMAVIQKSPNDAFSYVGEFHFANPGYNVVFQQVAVSLIG